MPAEQVAKSGDTLKSRVAAISNSAIGILQPEGFQTNLSPFLVIANFKAVWLVRALEEAKEPPHGKNENKDYH